MDLGVESNEIHHGKHLQGPKGILLIWFIGVFRGELNPLSSRSVVDTRVLPVLYLTGASLEKLENFQCTLGKRIVRLSHSHSNTSVLIGLDWPSMRAHQKVELSEEGCYGRLR